MNPDTPSWLLDWVASVVGIPYKSCKHVGVMVVSQLEGTASEERLERAEIFLVNGEVTAGPTNGVEKL